MTGILKRSGIYSQNDFMTLLHPGKACKLNLYNAEKYNTVQSMVYYKIDSHTLKLMLTLQECKLNIYIMLKLKNTLQYKLWFTIKLIYMKWS